MQYDRWLDSMSDNVLSVIPADPRWQPEPSRAEQARDLIETLLPVDPDAVDPEIRISWHQAITVIDCGANLERITCPHCGTDIDTGWWGDLLEERYEAGFDDLSVVLPCCGRGTSLTDLTYDWPCGFARFEIEIWNPGRDWFTDAELAAVAKVIGHPVRQVMAHI
jgi:hypothetical protein